MGTIADKLNKALANKADIKNALIEQGQDPNDNMSTWGDEIRAIETGGGGEDTGTGEFEARYCFFDKYGKYQIISKYADIMGTFAKPTTPIGDIAEVPGYCPALTFQGWNFLDSELEYVTGDLDIGAIYIPTDNKTHFYLQITGATTLETQIFIQKTGSGVLTIEWGDGTADFTTTSTGNSSPSHTFTSRGVYHCKISIDAGSSYNLGQGSESTAFCGGREATKRDALVAIFIGDNAKISNSAFYKCRSLTAITMPNGITSIGSSAFTDCFSLTTIIIPRSMISIGYYAFLRCYGLKNAIIPNSVIDLGAYTFNDCRGLQTIVIPNSITSIKNSTFYNCYSLKRITIPNNVTSIAAQAFCVCPSIKKVILEGSAVKKLISSNGFDSTANSLLIFVEDDLLDTYKGYTNWVTYANQIMPISEEGNYYG